MRVRRSDQVATGFGSAWMAAVTPDHELRLTLVDHAAIGLMHEPE
jgi:hypothetical protein